MAFGDVLMVIALILGAASTLWAGIVVFSLLFPAKVRTAREHLEQRAGRAVGGGLITALLAGGVGLVLANLPNGLVKLIGWGVLLGLLTLAVLGSAGIASLVSERIGRADETLSPLAATGRAAGLMVAAGFMPLVGWFVIGPLALAASLGAGLVAVLAKPVRKAAPAATIEEATPAVPAPGAF